MGKDWHSIFFKARIQPLEIPKVVGCQFGAIRLIRRIFGRANSWNRETCNIKTHHSTRGFFFHHFFILFIVAWVFCFQHKNPIVQRKNWMPAILSWKNLKNLQKSRSSSGWISHITIHPHSSPFLAPGNSMQKTSPCLVAVVITEPQVKEQDWGHQVMFR